MRLLVLYFWVVFHWYRSKSLTLKLMNFSVSELSMAVSLFLNRKCVPICPQLTNTESKEPMTHFRNKKIQKKINKILISNNGICTNPRKARNHILSGLILPAIFDNIKATAAMKFTTNTSFSGTRVRIL